MNTFDHHLKAWTLEELIKCTFAEEPNSDSSIRNQSPDSINKNSICDYHEEINAFAAEVTPQLQSGSPPLSPYNGNEFEESFLASILPDDMFYTNSGGTGGNTTTNGETSGSDDKTNNNGERETNGCDVYAKSANTTDTSERMPDTVVINEVIGDYGVKRMESGNDESESVVALTDFLEVEIVSISTEKIDSKRKRGRPPLNLTKTEKDAKRRAINKISAQKLRAKKYVEEEAHYAELEQLEKEQQLLRQRARQLKRDIEWVSAVLCAANEKSID